MRDGNAVRFAIRLDSHDDAVPDEVWALLDTALPRLTGLRGATLERIEGPVGEHEVQRLISELHRLRALVADVGLPMAPPADPPDEAPPIDPSSDLTPAERALNRAMAALTRTPSADAGDQVAHRLIVKLRFSRLLRGDPSAEAWFDEDPEAFVAAFRDFHAQTPCEETPWDEARAWRAWRS